MSLIKSLLKTRKMLNFRHVHYHMITQGNGNGFSMNRRILSVIDNMIVENEKNVKLQTQTILLLVSTYFRC